MAPRSRRPASGLRRFLPLDLDRRVAGASVARPQRRPRLDHGRVLASQRDRRCLDPVGQRRHLDPGEQAALGLCGRSAVIAGGPNHRVPERADGVNRGDRNRGPASSEPRRSGSRRVRADDTGSNVRHEGDEGPSSAEDPRRVRQDARAAPRDRHAGGGEAIDGAGRGDGRLHLNRLRQPQPSALHQLQRRRVEEGLLAARGQRESRQGRVAAALACAPPQLR